MTAPITDARLRRLIRGARGGMRGLVVDDDAEIVAAALEQMLETRQHARRVKAALGRIVGSLCAPCRKAGLKCVSGACECECHEGKRDMTDKAEVRTPACDRCKGTGDRNYRDPQVMWAPCLDCKGTGASAAHADVEGRKP